MEYKIRLLSRIGVSANNEFLVVCFNDGGFRYGRMKDDIGFYDINSRFFQPGQVRVETDGKKSPILLMEFKISIFLLTDYNNIVTIK